MLTAPQHHFLQEYLIDGNASAAAERAGLHRDSGRRMLKDQEVREELERLNAELAVELAARRQRLLDRLEAIVFADPTPLIKFALGAPQSPAAENDIADIPADLLSLLDVRVSVSTRGRRFTLNLPNRLRALTLLAKLLGLTTPAKPVTIEPEPEIRQESHGLHGAGGPLMKTCECWYCREAREEAGIPHPRELCWEQRNPNTFFTTQKDSADNQTQPYNSRQEDNSTVWKPTPVAPTNQTPAQPITSPIPNPIPQSQNPINQGADNPTQNSALKTQNYTHPYLRPLPAPWEGVHYPDIDIPSDVPIHTWLSRRGFLPYQPDLEDDLEIDPKILRPATWD